MYTEQLSIVLMKLIKSLYRLSGESGILVLENSRNKRVLLIRTSDALGSLSRILRATKSRNKRWKLLRKDVNKLDIKLVSEDSSRVNYQYWVTQYESQGYEFYNKYKAIEYTVKIDIVQEGHVYDVLVKLVSRNRTEVIVGVFDSLEEAEGFVRTYYPSDKGITQVIYGMNQRSREMLSKSESI